MFAAKNEQVAKRGTLLATVFLLPIAVGTVWIGMTAALTYPGIENSNSVLSTFVMASFPAGLKGLMLVGILAALMSTADICILTASANGSRDIYQRYINPDVSPKKMFRISMWLAAFVGLLAALIAWQMQDVISILLIAFTINSAALFVPTIAIVIQNKVNNDAAFWSITLSLITVIGWFIGSTLELASIFIIDPLWPGFLVSLVVFVGIGFLASAKNDDRPYVGS
jgi:SSS family solute:Na+ symporter